MALDGLLVNSGCRCSMSPAGRLVAPSHTHPADPDELLTLLIAYASLLEASREARQQGARALDRPVTLLRLGRLQVASEVLLWMMYQAHVNHLRPIAEGTDGLGVDTSLLLSEQSSFAL